MVSVEEVVEKLTAKARPEQLGGMAKYGMMGEKRLGVSIPELRRMAKEIGSDHELALGLWGTGIQEARILAAMIERPAVVTEEQMEAWVKDIDSWDVCDQVCMNLFEKIPSIRKKITEWSRRNEEFVKRTAFSLIACLAWHDKKAPDDDFIRFISLIKLGAADERNYVRKAVNWALRNIGKKNQNLNRAALEAARDIRQMNSKAARWVASDAIRELTSEAVQKRLSLQ